MRAFRARLVVLACALIVLAATVAIAEGHAWPGFGALAVATAGAIAATTRVPDDRILFGVLFATLAFGAVSRYQPLSGGITGRHAAALLIAASILHAFVVLVPRVARRGQRQLNDNRNRHSI